MTVNSLPERFWAKVAKREGGVCWSWNGSTAPGGYGQIWYVGRLIRATHAAWLIHRGELPSPGVFICHSCDNPNCVNPAHLWAGTNVDNVRDMHQKGRDRHAGKMHCRRGHEYTPDNTRLDRSGARICRACRRVGGTS